MSDTLTRLAEAVDDLRAELVHADQLITEQQDRIQTLERRVQILRGKLNTQGAA